MIHIIIPVFNRIETTVACLESIFSHADEDIRVVVVDDGSTDGTEQRITNEYPQVTILKGDGNLYWTGAVSFAISEVLKEAGVEDWILLANNDVKFERSTIGELIKVGVEGNRKAVVSAISLSMDDRQSIIKTGTIVRSWFFNSTKHIYEGMKYDSLPGYDPVRADLLTGRCLLHPVEVFSHAGNYDPVRFLHYAGDDEFSVRAARFGYKLYVAPRSIVYLDTSTTGDLENLWTGGLKTIIPRFFGIRSSINIIVKWKFAVAAAPFYAVPTYYLIAVLKSIYIFMRRT